MKKALAVLLLLSMLLSGFSLADGADGEPVTLTCFIGAAGEPPAENNKIYQKIQDEFGIRFQFDYLEEGANLSDRLGRILDGSDPCPDIIYGSYYSDMLVDGGMLINLMDYINPETTPRLWQHIDPWIGALVGLNENQSLTMYRIPDYGLYEGSIQIVNTITGHAFFIQKQVLEWAGYPVITTLDEYFDLIEDFIKSNPVDENGENYIGFSILCDDWRNSALINPVQFLMGRPYDGNVLVDRSSPDFHTETFIDKPYAKGYYQKLNEAFRKGLVDQDTFTDTYEDFCRKVSSGRVLGMFDQYWNIASSIKDLLDAGMFGKTYAALGLVYSSEYLSSVEHPFESDELEEHYLNGTMPSAGGFGISASCECPERIIAMWEEMMSDEWQLLLNWGVEGEDFSIDEEGRLQMSVAQYEQTLDSEWIKTNKAAGLFSHSPKKQGYIRYDIRLGDRTAAAGNCWSPSDQPEVVYETMNDYDKAFLAAYGFMKWSDFLNPPASPAPYGEAWSLDWSPVADAYYRFAETESLELPELIRCPADEFDSRWDAFVKKISPDAKVYEEYMQELISSYI